VDTAAHNVRRLIIEIDLHGDGAAVDRMYDDGAAGEFASEVVRGMMLTPDGRGVVHAHIRSAYWHNAPTTQNKGTRRDGEAIEYRQTIDTTRPR